MDNSYRENRVPYELRQFRDASHDCRLSLIKARLSRWCCPRTSSFSRTLSGLGKDAVRTVHNNIIKQAEKGPKKRNLVRYTQHQILKL